MNFAHYTLVIPCHNEAKRLRPERFRAFLSAHPEASLLFVDDGSDDATAATLRGFDVLRLARNRGKAEAVRTGVLHCLARSCPPDYIGFMDADLAAPLEEAARLARALDVRPEALMAAGSRWPHLGGDVRRAPLRLLEGRMMAALVRWVAGIPVYDSQCGAKLFRASVARTLFGHPFLSRWLFDVELFLRLPGGVRRAVEIPLERWHEVGGSGLGLLDGLRAPFELLRIAWYTRPDHLFCEVPHEAADCRG